MRDALLVLIVVAALAAPATAADEPRRFEVAAGLTMQIPEDVNLQPRCDELGIYCGASGRTFPDFGLSVSLAGRLAGPVALIGEAHLWGNQWRADAALDGLRVNHVRSALAGIQVRRDFVAGKLGEFRLFGQALAGPQWASVMPVRPVVQFGGGVDMLRRGPAHVRIQIDRLVVGTGARDLSAWRTFMGAVFR